jgi:hypothetical protein
MKKRFKKQKDLIRSAIKKTGYIDYTEDQLTYDEKLAKNLLILNGIHNPSYALIQQAMKNVEEANEKIDDIIEVIESVDNE